MKFKNQNRRIVQQLILSVEGNVQSIVTNACELEKAHQIVDIVWLFDLGCF